MDSQHDQEAHLRSFIQQRARDFQTQVERIAQNRDTINVDALEREVDRQSEQFIADVRNRLDTMRNDIKSRRPTNPNDPDFASQMARYQQFVSGASVGVRQVTTWVNKIFEKIIQMIREVIKWIVDKANTVISVLEMIRDSFNEFIRFAFQ